MDNNLIVRILYKE